MKKIKIEKTVNDVKERYDQLQNLVSSLYSERSSSSDVTLECDGGVVKAHRVVLTSSCNYFDAMFRSNLAESNTGKIKYPEFNVDVMEIIVKFLYTGFIEEADQTVDFLTQILSIGHMMQFRNLLQYTTILLIPKLNWDNYLEILDLASKLDQTRLVDGVLAFVHTDFAKFETDRIYVPFTLAQMCDLLRSMSDKYSTEKHIQIILEWMENNRDGRTKAAAYLLTLLNLSKLTNACFYQLSNDERIMSCPEILAILFPVAALRTFRYHLGDKKGH